MNWVAPCGRNTSPRRIVRGGATVGAGPAHAGPVADYTAQRKHAAKPIGSFQAVKHHLADVATQLEFAKPVLYRAAGAPAHGQSTAPVWAPQARLACCEASWLAARHGIQVHGAMGYTWEVDLQMFMKRAWALGQRMGRSRFVKPGWQPMY